VKEPDWIPIDALVDLHVEQIREHGGATGLRDRGLLESALARPQQVFAYGDPKPDLASLAAAYGWAICRNHPFVDGNKRMALIAIAIFLEINGASLDTSERDARDTILRAAASEITEHELADWVRTKTRVD
jgi:death on curing protein